MNMYLLLESNVVLSQLKFVEVSTLFLLVDIVTWGGYVLFICIKITAYNKYYL